MTNSNFKLVKPKACVNCRILLSKDQFIKSGCPNCSSIDNTDGRNYECNTSSYYKGQIIYLNTKKSWIARWQKNTECINGFYAISVNDELTDDLMLQNDNK